MADVVNRLNPSVYRLSVDTPDYPNSDWIRNPPSLDALLAAGVDSQYWKLNNADPAAATDVLEMTAEEKAVVDDANSEAALAERRSLALEVDTSTSPEGLLIRALIDQINRDRAWARNRIAQLQDVLIDVKNQSNGQGMRDIIPERAGFYDVTPRQRSGAIDEYRADVQAGNQDA